MLVETVVNRGPACQGSRQVSMITAVGPTHKGLTQSASGLFRIQYQGRDDRMPRFASARLGPYFGCDTTRRYGFSVLKPCGYFFLASSSDTDVGIITS